MSVLTITPAEMRGQWLNDSSCPLYHRVPFEPQTLLDDLGVQKLTGERGEGEVRPGRGQEGAAEPGLGGDVEHVHQV